MGLPRGKALLPYHLVDAHSEESRVNNYILSTYYVPGAGDTVVNKIDRHPCLREQTQKQ